MAGIFKAYDIRGAVPEQLDEPLAEKIGRAIALYLGAQTMVVGRDMRDSGIGLSRALIRGINSTGCDVVDIGILRNRDDVQRHNVPRAHISPSWDSCRLSSSIGARRACLWCPPASAEPIRVPHSP